MKSDAPTSRLETFTLPAGLVMLAVWVLGMVMMNPAPGWLHFLLIFGVFAVIWGIVVRGGRPASKQGER